MYPINRRMDHRHSMVMLSSLIEEEKMKITLHASIEDRPDGIRR